MEKIIEIDSEWRLNIESYVFSLCGYPDERRLKIEGTLQNFQLPPKSPSPNPSWINITTREDVIMSPNWLHKRRKITWEMLAEKYESKLVNELMYIRQEKIKTRKMNENLYKSLDEII